MKTKGKMSIFGGPKDEGVAPDEGLALIEPGDLIEWWFRRLFLPAHPPNTSGLARRLNPEAFYIAMRWPEVNAHILSVGKEIARRAIFRLTANDKSIFAQAVDYGPGRHKRMVDMSPGAAEALGLTTDDIVEVEMIA